MSIEIANPRLGGMRYTSDRTAADLVKRGIAIWLPDGRIQFRGEGDLRRRAAEMRQTFREEEYEFARNRGGIVFWNGSDHPLLMHRPGEVIS